MGITLPQLGLGISYVQILTSDDLPIERARRVDAAEADLPRGHYEATYVAVFVAEKVVSEPEAYQAIAAGRHFEHIGTLAHWSAGDSERLAAGLRGNDLDLAQGVERIELHRRDPVASREEQRLILLDRRHTGTAREQSGTDDPQDEQAAHIPSLP